MMEIQTIVQWVMADLAQCCDGADCMLVTNQVAQTKLFGYCPRRNGTQMCGTLDVEFNPAEGKVHIRAYAGKVNPMKPEKAKALKLGGPLGLGFHELCDEGYRAFKQAVGEMLKPAKVEEPVERKSVEIPEELLNQLVSSDGTVLAEKADGQWQDVPEEKPVRDHECWNCKHKWTAVVVHSDNTQNLSGESSFCPNCGKKSSASSPVRNVESKPLVNDVTVIADRPQMTHYVKARKVGRKQWQFLGNNGTMTRLRVHALQYTEAGAKEVAAHSVALNNGEYEFKAVRS
jgi:hypothetical protein